MGGGWVPWKGAAHEGVLGCLGRGSRQEVIAVVEGIGGGSSMELFFRWRILVVENTCKRFVGGGCGPARRGVAECGCEG